MSVTVNHSVIINVAEILESNTESMTAANRTVTHSNFNHATAVLTSATTPPVTKVAAWKQALAAGAATVDLTALTGTNGASVDGTGLKVQILKVKNLGANSLTLTFGAANPYNLLGAAFVIVLLTGQEITVYGNDATPDIAAGAKDIDLAGTLIETSEWIVVMG